MTRGMVLALIVLVGSNGCTMFPSLSTQPQNTDALVFQAQLERVNNHLRMMRNLRTADYRSQEKLFAAIASEANPDANPTARLRLALALVTGGHPNTDIGRGYLLLKELGDDPAGLSDPEINLARVLLEEVETLMILEARNAELTDVVDQTRRSISRSGESSRSSLEQANERAQNLQIENETLRNELQEALQKLDAIKNIEVSSD